MGTRDIISQIRALKDEDIDKWINDRISFLDQTTVETRNELDLFHVNLRRLKGKKENTEIQGFIPSKTQIKKMAFDIASFRLDDKSYYRTIVDSIRTLDEVCAYRIGYIMNIIQYTLINYLGLHGTEARRNALYNSRDEIEDGPLSISDFQRNGTAMCVEKSAMAHNILSFLDCDAMMIYGYLSNNNGTINEGHAYNCVIFNKSKKAYLIDFTNPVYKDKKYYKMSVYELNEEQLNAFKKGKGLMEVQHTDYYTENGELKEDITTLVYSSDEIDPHYFDVIPSTDDKQQKNMLQQIKQREIPKENK